ncbi:MAG: hypothetical protein RJB39_414 [Candidatus Parcubacteria bacterium]|jgi:ABC-type glycerol-3-phosphate transport system substrate-binding protein
MSVTKDLNVFQLVVLGIFIFIGVVGVVLFATSKSREAGSSYDTVIWGVLPKSAIDAALAPYQDKGVTPNITYVEYAEEGFAQALLVAVAEGRGPDAIVFPSDMYFSQANKLVTIPSESVAAKTFVDTYIDAGKAFAVQGGIKAFPLVTDPLVMYWNKDMFSAAGILAPPANWNQLSGMVSKLARKQDNGVIDRAFVSLGEYANINYAKRILYTMMAQAGVNLTYYDTSRGSYASGLLAQKENTGELSRSVLTFYTEFANPLKPSYSWNRSFTSSREAFLAGDLAVYFAPGSEGEYLRTRNPNLNFSTAFMPQESQDVKVVHGKTYGLGFLLTSKNVNGAIAEVTKYLTPATADLTLATALRMAPARRDVLASAKAPKEQPDLAVIYESAVYARDWVDPSPVTTDNIFNTMIDAITSGKQTLYEALQDASNRIDRLFGTQG